MTKHLFFALKCLRTDVNLKYEEKICNSINKKITPQFGKGMYERYVQHLGKIV